MKDWDVELLNECGSERNREMFMMRYAFGAYDKNHTYQEIGKVFNISGTRVAQILYRIKLKLGHHSREELREYINKRMENKKVAQ